MKIIRYVLGFIFLLGTVEWVANKFDRSMESSLLNDPPPPQAKTWNEVGRRVLLDQSWIMAEQSGWWIQGVPGDTNGVRFWLNGSFASSDPSVKLIVLDAENWNKYQAGYPPLALGTAGPDTAFHLPASTTGYYIAFWRQPGTSSGVPTSGAGVLLTLLRDYQARHPAPARMTAHVELCIETLCLPAQCEKDRMMFAEAIK
jgi:hypothetical protein